MRRVIAFWLVVINGALGSSFAVAAQSTLIVTVHTLGENGQEPAAGATIRVTDETYDTNGNVRVKQVAAGRTDVNGSAVLPLPSGRYVVTVSADGYKPTRDHAYLVGGHASMHFGLYEPAEPEPPADVRSESLPPAVVSGRVLTLAGEPLRGAVVSLSGVTEAARPGDDGSFRIVARVASEGTYLLKVAPSILPLYPEIPTRIYVPDVEEHSVDVPVLPGQETGGVDIRLPAHTEFRLNVALSDGTGHVPAKAAVDVYRPPSSVRSVRPDGMHVVRHGPRGGLGLRNSDGTFSIGPLPPGPVTVVAVDDRLNPELVATARVEVEADGTNEVSLELLRGASVSGRVVFAGLTEPLHSASPLQVSVQAYRGQGVSSGNSNGRVAADGSFRVSGLVGERCLTLGGIPGGWRLAAVDQAGRNIMNVPLTFDLGQEVSGVTFFVVPGPVPPGEKPSGASCPLE
jgi:hypothetical protein